MIRIVSNFLMIDKDNYDPNNYVKLLVQTQSQILLQSVSETFLVSSLQMHWISVRFYEMGDRKKSLVLNQRAFAYFNL